MREKLQVREETKQLVVFKLGDEEFGVDILQVREIEKLDQPITRVPRAPEFVEGVINLRGEVIPIVDLRKRFGLVVRDISNQSRVIIVELNNNQVGMVVDAVVEVLRVNLSDIDPAPAITKGVDAYFLNGVAKQNDRLIVLLNLEKALSAEETKELSSMNMEAAE
ncbi:purine-binding chemotaxis protein CheW [Hydrogenispora ethanolica]|jgi:purine-binding chemotaxis protein CheW|uniref:Chemotaxis protein CheW n=1 Tax=Hydrogenispora ethanolica TaxID=1082276 RepID=A0A4R1RKI2_HYDET|nr:chemotaxis protein CheW [Hydrogenispora ethanolica]TCL66566.1 purine-binding chemotaxis protein CheW [Hydrogenispora ethanolica]